MRKRGVSSSQLRGCFEGTKKKRTYVVEVDVYTAKVREYKISDSVCPLYRLGIVVEGVQEPRVFGSDKLA